MLFCSASLIHGIRKHELPVPKTSSTSLLGHDRSMFLITCEKLKYSRKQSEIFLWAKCRCVPGRQAPALFFRKSLHVLERSHLKTFFVECYWCFKTSWHSARTHEHTFVYVEDISNMNITFRKVATIRKSSFWNMAKQEKNGSLFRHWISKYNRSLETHLSALQPYLLVIVFFLLISPVFI